MAAKPDTALEQARAAAVLASIMPGGTQLGSHWCGAFRYQGATPDALHPALDQPAIAVKIVDRAGEYGPCAWPIDNSEVA